MGVHISFRRTNPIQRYTDDILKIAPKRRKADLVARAVYSYLGGKQTTEDDLYIMLTGHTAPASDDETPPVSPAKVSAPKRKKADAPKKGVAAPTLYNKEESEPSAAPQEIGKPKATDNSLPDTDSDGYQFTAEDDAMLQGTMAAFQNT